MFCTNCGAKVDENAKFCPVCGNKLEKAGGSISNSENKDTTIVEKSTYESITTKENIIDKQSEKNEAKPNRFKQVFSNLTKTKEADNEKNPSSEINVPEGQSELRNKNVKQTLGNNEEEQSEIPSAYYGFNPTNDRTSKEKRLQSKGESYQLEDYPKSTSKDDQKTVASEDIDSSKSLQNTSKENVDTPSQVKEEASDIPREQVEARIANYLRRGMDDSSKKAEKEGNIAALIRNHQQGSDDVFNQPPPAKAWPKNTKASQQSSLDKTNEEEKLDLLEKESGQGGGDSKKGFEFKPIYLLPILLLIGAIVGGYLFLNRKPKDVEIDLSNYIEVSYQGENSQASPQASLDTSKLLNDYGSQLAYIRKDRKKDQYSSPANQFIEELQKSTTFQFSKDSNLSNGEEITVVANVSDSTLADDYNVLFANTIKSVIVDGLVEEEYIDPFAYINVDYNGESPNISLTTSLSEDAPEYMGQVEIVPGKTSELKAGEEVNVSLNYNEDEIFNTYQVRFSSADKTYTVPGDPENDASDEDQQNSPNLAEGFVDTVDSLSEDLLGELKTNAENLLKDTFNERSFTKMGSLTYLGAVTGSDTNSEDLKNRVMLLYEIKANEDYEGLYQNEFTYYTLVEYQNVKDKKDDQGKFYSQGPLTTDNEIYHKFFVADDYTYYEIPYYGFGFLEEVLARVNNSLSGLSLAESIAVDQSQYFAKSDGIVGEYQGSGSRLTLKDDGSLRYQKDSRVHQGSWKDEGGQLSLTIQGINVDTPINAKFENETINVSEQGEMNTQTFNKMQAL